MLNATTGLSHHGHGPAELTRTCSITDTDSTADNLPGPGRLVDNCLVYMGLRFELFLGKIAVKTGKGPLVTAQRIRRHQAEIIAAKLCHDKTCRCYDCQFLREFGPNSGDIVIGSPDKLKKLNSQISKDCRRLVAYVKHTKYSTRAQAVESVRDLSACDAELRAILKANGASRAIEEVIHTYRRFRFNDYDALLSSSRKALVTLDDSRLNSLIKNFINAAGCLPLSKEILVNSWAEISVYLWMPDHAFLVMRALGRVLATFSAFHLFERDCVFRSVTESPGYFEWKECEAVLRKCFRWRDLLFPDEVDYRSVNLSDWLLCNISRMPGPLLTEVRGLIVPQEDIFRDQISFQYFHGTYFGIAQEIGRAGCKELSLEWLESKYTYEPLRPLLERLACPLMTIVREFVWRDYGFQGHTPDAEERCLYDKIVPYVDARQVPFEPERFTLTSLSNSEIGNLDGFPRLSEALLYCCCPYIHRDDAANFRRHDVDDIKQFLEGQSRRYDSENIKNISLFGTFRDLTLKLIKGRGEAYWGAGYYPFLAGWDRQTGTRTVAATIVVPDFYCGDVIWSFRALSSVVMEGTKPEDLRVEVQCPHARFLMVPKEIVVPLLRYTPEACARALGVAVESLPTMDRCSLNSSHIGEGKEFFNDRPYQARVLTVEDAIASGYSEWETYHGELALSCPKFDSDREGEESFSDGDVVEDVGTETYNDTGESYYLCEACRQSYQDSNVSTRVGKSACSTEYSHVELEWESQPGSKICDRSNHSDGECDVKEPDRPRDEDEMLTCEETAVQSCVLDNSGGSPAAYGQSEVLGGHDTMVAGIVCGDGLQREASELVVGPEQGKFCDEGVVKDEQNAGTSESRFEWMEAFLTSWQLRFDILHLVVLVLGLALGKYLL